jgi:peptide/nickel transport system permease protein
MSQTTTSIEPSVAPKTVAADLRAKRASRGFFASSFARFFRDKLSVVALLIFVLIAFVCYNADFVAKNILQQERDKINFGLLSQGLQPPVAPGVGGHIFGTDEAGRDLAVRLVYGGQVSITVGLLTAAIAVFIGTTLGLLAGFFGGWVDDLVNAIVQVILNIPTLFLLIILSLIWKPDVLSLSIIIGCVGWVSATRQVRGAVMSLRGRDYVDAARVLGAGNTRILVNHILPNVISIMMVVVGFDIVGAMLGEAGLSFLGFGIGVPTPSWGNMLSDSRLYFTTAPWMVYIPALAIFVTVLCVYLVADGLRDAFDPRLTNR